MTGNGVFYGTVAGGGPFGYGGIYIISVVNAAPTAPSNLTAVAGNGRVSLSWTASSSDTATTYNVYQGTSAGGESATPIQTGLTGTTATVAALTNGTTYYFTVAGVNSTGTSAMSNEASATPTTAPGQVTGLTATAGSGSVSLTWSATSGATSYTVYQSTSSGAETPVATGVSGTSYTAAGLVNGSTYYFEVAAVNGAGSGPMSAEVSATPLAPAAIPHFSPAGGTYNSAQSVTLSDSTPGATIYFTTDGSAPTTSSTAYSGAITVASTQTIKAVAVAPGYSASTVATATYTITPPAAMPSFNPVGGSYSSVQTVTLSDDTSGATIYYTTDGSTPTTASSVYAGPITVAVSQTIKAIAAAPGYSASDVASANYTITIPIAATPSFSPGAGSYSSIQTVTISDATPGAVLYYTTDGSAPTTGSTLYTGPVMVMMSETLSAIAVASGYANSAVATASYLITLPPPVAATPSFSPAAGTYTGTQTITISDATPNAAIYYTTDGSTPTANSIVYTGPIMVSSSETISAIAFASGYSASPVASASYTITQGGTSGGTSGGSTGGSTSGGSTGGTSGGSTTGGSTGSGTTTGSTAGSTSSGGGGAVSPGLLIFACAAVGLRYRSRSTLRRAAQLL